MIFIFILFIPNYKNNRENKKRKKVSKLYVLFFLKRYVTKMCFHVIVLFWIWANVKGSCTQTAPRQGGLADVAL